MLSRCSDPLGEGTGAQMGMGSGLLTQAAVMQRRERLFLFSVDAFYSPEVSYCTNTPGCSCSCVFIYQMCIRGLTMGQVLF